MHLSGGRVHAVQAVVSCGEHNIIVLAFGHHAYIVCPVAVVVGHGLYERSYGLRSDSNARHTRILLCHPHRSIVSHRYVLEHIGVYYRLRVIGGKVAQFAIGVVIDKQAVAVGGYVEQSVVSACHTVQPPPFRGEKRTVDEPELPYLPFRGEYPQVSDGI